ncbi:hypothetical protein [Promicromonospora soli]
MSVRRLSGVGGVSVAVFGLLLLSACSTEGGRITAVYGAADSRELEISVDTCNRNPVAEVEETPESVTVSVAVDSASWWEAQGECQDAVLVTLQDQLGERSIVDGDTGRDLDLLPADG